MESTVVQNKALQFAQRRENNLRFFKKYYPDIYRHFVDFKQTRAEVVISNEEDEVDLNFDGRSLYHGQGKARAHQGVELFKSVFKKDSVLPSLPPPWPGDYRHPRFAHSAVDRIVRLSPLERQSYKGYPIPNFYPLVVFQGVGLGYQIEELVTTTEIENAVVLEPESEIFGASLLTVDWARICSEFQKTGRSLRFLIGVEQTEEALCPALIRHLMHFTPIFPIMNLFLNERGDSTMDNVAKRLNKEALASLGVWGHYDDEVRQLNNALHAFHQGVKVIPPKRSVQSSVPVLIVGSGPSLDERLDDIKAVRDQVVVISAGTGLRVLIENDIYPDFHVELESDYRSYQVISSYNREKLKSLRIIAASQVCPLIWGLFGEQRLYFKKENPIGAMFGTPETNIAAGTPTCTNAAIALSSQLGLNNLFLFGTDFGFQDRKHHHAKSSVYMESEDETIGTQVKEGAKKAFNKGRTFQVAGVNDSVVHTTHIYFTAKRATESLIETTVNHYPDALFFNCADGADIEGATWTSRENFLDKARASGDETKRHEVVEQLFRTDAQTVSLTDMENQLEHTQKKLSELAKILEDWLITRRVRGKKDITRLCSEISRYLEGQLQKEDLGFYYMIRGTVRHFLYVGFAHTMAMSDDQQIATFLDKWKKAFIGCMNGLPSHFASVTGKKYVLEDDPWVRQSINDPE
ncbi:MAG: DUF115 domain-containing protein [Marinobacter sp.]|nr:DUF115 domain-containing protein [Marinobacter sp.]